MDAFPDMLVDRFQRRVDYLRLSVTDRCDFRCVYCMAEEMQFLPRREILSLEELFEVARVFTGLGIGKIRLTGGEPLVRRGILDLVRRLGALDGLRELALTTNGSQLARMAPALREAGLSSVNISLDSLQPARFRQLTRSGDLDQVLRGIDAAVSAGFARIKLNAVILRGRNDDEVLDLVRFARARGVDIAFIEEMPLGHIVEHDRVLSLVTSEELRAEIDREYPLTALGEPGEGAGPARYYAMAGHDSRVGFISPHSDNFCHLCNRVRLTVAGRLLLCLGNEHSVDLRQVLRAPDYAPAQLIRAILRGLAIKPERHHFGEEDAAEIVRFMNLTGG